MEGLEPTTLAVTAKKAAEEGHKGATAEAGPWMVTLDYSTYNAVVSFAKDRELRKKLYIAYRRIAADNSTDNTNVIKQLLAIRQELSQLIGFPNYAEQSFLGKVRAQPHTRGGGEGSSTRVLDWNGGLYQGQTSHVTALCLSASHTIIAAVADLIWRAAQHTHMLARRCSSSDGVAAWPHTETLNTLATDPPPSPLACPLFALCADGHPQEGQCTDG